MHFARNGRREHKTVQKGKVFCVCSETLRFLACSSFLPTLGGDGEMIPPWVAMQRPATRRAALHPIPLPAGGLAGTIYLVLPDARTHKGGGSGGHRVPRRAQTGWRGRSSHGAALCLAKSGCKRSARPPTSPPRAAGLRGKGARGAPSVQLARLVYNGRAGGGGGCLQPGLPLTQETQRCQATPFKQSQKPP